METTRGHPHEPNGRGNHVDGSDARTEVYSVKNDEETAADKMGNVRMHRNSLKTQNSPYMTEIVMFKHTYQRRRVSVNNSDMYLPWNAPVEVLG